MANKQTCNCIHKTTEALQKRIKEKIESDYNVAEWKDKGRYMNIGYDFSGGDTKIGMPFVATYIRKKVNGEPEKRDTNITTYIYPTYCPFCGKKFKET